MLQQKGIFCYDYIDRIEKLMEPTLPAREHFFNKLSNEECSEDDYRLAKMVFQEFNCVNL